MNQKVLIGIIVALLIVGGFLFLKPQEANGPTQDKIKMADETPEKETVVKKQDASADVDFENLEGDIVYYYGAECPHCLDVNEFLEENNIASKVEFVKKEVWHDKNNANELSEVAQKCGINPGSIGVPFLAAGGKCYIGGPDVEGFFSKAAGM